jgi:hypothetical protein
MQACELSTGRRSDLLIYVAWDLELYLNLVDLSEHENAAYLPAVM